MRTLCLALLAALALAAPAAAAERTVAIPAPGPGPAGTDKVYVTKVGPGSAKPVLLLMPGYQGGAGDFTLVAREIVKRVPGLQVWALDRRSQSLEDTSMFAKGPRGQATVQQGFDYYLGWIAKPQIQPHFQPIDQKRYGYAKQ